jgi:hypothetical protein
MANINVTEYIGLTLEAAKAKAKENGLQSRVRVLNGQPMIGTADWKPERLNFFVEDGIVEKVTLG